MSAIMQSTTFSSTTDLIPRQRRYVLISPCRNEAHYIRRTLETVGAQTFPPALWVIVDDGSTDETPQILAEFSEKLPFLRVVRREDRGFRSVGPGVIDTFYAGLDTIALDDFEYLCKLDADLELPPGYFERMIREMEAEPRLGNVSGKVFLREPDGTLSHERRGDENAVGPAKFYRIAAFRDIGGFVRHVGWDGIDGHVCRLRGWIAKSIYEPEIGIIHQRQMGSSDKSVFKGRIRVGAGKWYIGSSLPYVLATAIYRMFDAPYVIGAVLMVYGYVSSMLRGDPRYGNEEYRNYLRSYEWASLVMGKKRATERRNAAIRSRFDTASPNKPQT